MKEKILLIGMPSCGKSSIGKIISNETNLNFIDMDEYIEKEEETKISTIFDKFGETYFRNLETKASKTLSKMNNVVISSGGGIILKKINIDYFKENGFYTIFINRDIDNILNTKDLQSDRPLLKDDKNKIYKLYQERIDLYYLFSDITIDNNQDIKKCVNKIIEIL